MILAYVTWLMNIWCVTNWVQINCKIVKYIFITVLNGLSICIIRTNNNLDMIYMYKTVLDHFSLLQMNHDYVVLPIHSLKYSILVWKIICVVNCRKCNGLKLNVQRAPTKRWQHLTMLLHHTIHNRSVSISHNASILMHVWARSNCCNDFSRTNIEIRLRITH